MLTTLGRRLDRSKYRISFLAALLVPTFCLAQQVPELHGTSLSGHGISLPSDARGKVAVLVIGFAKESSGKTSEWALALDADRKSGARFVVYRLPFLQEVPRLFRSMAMASIRKATSGEDQDTVVPLFEGETAWKRFVNFSNSGDAYIVVLDQTSKPRYFTHEDAASLHGAVRRIVLELLTEK